MALGTNDTPKHSLGRPVASHHFSVLNYTPHRRYGISFRCSVTPNYWCSLGKDGSSLSQRIPRVDTTKGEIGPFLRNGGTCLLAVFFV